MISIVRLPTGTFTAEDRTWLLTGLFNLSLFNLSDYLIDYEADVAVCRMFELNVAKHAEKSFTAAVRESIIEDINP
jgi:hypothetical protein